MIKSKAQFGVLVGVHRNTIMKHCRNGKLHPRRDGKIDTEHPDNLAYIEIKKEEAATEAENKGKPKPVIEQKPKPERTPEEKPQRPKQKKARKKKKPIVDVDDMADDDIDINQQSKADLDKLKVVEDIKTKRQKRYAERDLLLDRNLVQTVFSKLYDVHINEFLTLKEKLMPDLSAVFGVNDNSLIMEAGKTLDAELWRTLEHIQSILNKYIESIDGEKIGA